VRSGEIGAGQLGKPVSRLCRKQSQSEQHQVVQYRNTATSFRDENILIGEHVISNLVPPISLGQGSPSTAAPPGAFTRPLLLTPLVRLLMHESQSQNSLSQWLNAKTIGGVRIRRALPVVPRRTEFWTPLSRKKISICKNKAFWPGDDECK
jgi:hypothetical protein